MSQLPTVAFYTLGCKLNFAETAAIANIFTERHFQIVDFDQHADFYVINTCSVTANANKKGRNAIMRAIHKNKNAVVIVTGCYAQLQPIEIQHITGVDYIFGTNDKSAIADIIAGACKQTRPQVFHTDYGGIRTYFPAVTKGSRTRGFIKVQDGCDYFCAYCTIPYARGRSRNVSVQQNVDKARRMVDEGVKELILSGVNIGDFGKSTGETFADLLHAFAAIDGLQRIRIGSIEPDLLSDDLIAFIAKAPNIMPHFHIPLQSGCDRILKLVGRRYNTALFKAKIETIRTLLPNAFIGIDLIVGLNGETPADFDATVDFVKALDISFIHHFRYSQRENTRALSFEPVNSPQTKACRANVIDAISRAKHHDFLSSQLGKSFNVLFEAGEKHGKMYGFTENYIKVETAYNQALTNQIAAVRLTGFASEAVMRVDICD